MRLRRRRESARGLERRLQPAQPAAGGQRREPHPPAVVTQVSGTVGRMIQQRVVFGPERVISIRLTCRRCGNEAVWHSTSSVKHPPVQCSFCPERHSWLESGLWSEVESLGKALQAIRKMNAKDKKFQVRFEIGAPVGSTQEASVESVQSSGSA